jgi:hypothetical protein
LNFLRKLKSWCPQPQDRLTTKLKNYSKPTGIVIAATLILVISFSLILSQYALTQSVPQPPIIKTPTENSQTLPQASPTQLTPTPQPTSQPTAAPTQNTPTITPIPTIPTCKIAYYEKSRTYDVDNDVTKIQIEIVIKTQGTSDSDGSYGFNYYNFYLAENGVPIPNQSMYGVTNHTVILTSANGVIGNPTFQIIGNYTSTGYQLSYDNFPIGASWSKEQQPINIIFF